MSRMFDSIVILSNKSQRTARLRKGLPRIHILRLIQQDKGITADNMELEFEQGLTDTYSALFVEMDPGDYFNFQCEFAKGFNSDDHCNLQNLTNGLNNGGLEEEEIVE